VLAIISLKLRRLCEGQQKLNSDTPTKQAFAEEVRNRFQALGEQQEMTASIRPFEKQRNSYLASDPKRRKSGLNRKHGKRQKRESQPNRRLTTPHQSA
jgi:hypothetical protein